MRKHERKNAVYVYFKDLEKVYYRVNKEDLRNKEVLRMYNMGLNF